MLRRHSRPVYGLYTFNFKDFDNSKLQKIYHKMIRENLGIQGN